MTPIDNDYDDTQCALHTHARTQTHIHTHTQTHTHTHIHRQTDRHTNTHTNTHTSCQPLFHWYSPSASSIHQLQLIINTDNKWRFGRCRGIHQWASYFTNWWIHLFHRPMRVKSCQSSCHWFQLRITCRNRMSLISSKTFPPFSASDPVLLFLLEKSKFWKSCMHTAE